MNVPQAGGEQPFSNEMYTEQVIRESVEPVITMLGQGVVSWAQEAVGDAAIDDGTIDLEGCELIADPETAGIRRGRASVPGEAKLTPQEERANSEYFDNIRFETSGRGGVYEAAFGDRLNGTAQSTAEDRMALFDELAQYWSTPALGPEDDPSFWN